MPHTLLPNPYNSTLTLGTWDYLYPSPPLACHIYLCLIPIACMPYLCLMPCLNLALPAMPYRASPTTSLYLTLLTTLTFHPLAFPYGGWFVGWCVGWVPSPLPWLLTFLTLPYTRPAAQLLPFPFPSPHYYPCPASPPCLAYALCTLPLPLPLCLPALYQLHAFLPFASQRIHYRFVGWLVSLCFPGGCMPSSSTTFAFTLILLVGWTLIPAPPSFPTL